MGVYGDNRVGKTTLACTFPKPLLLVSFETNLTGGALSVRKVPGVTLLQITRSADAFALADELKAECPFKTVVLDSATSLQDIHLIELLGLQSLPEQLDFNAVSADVYRARADRTKESLRPFLNLKTHTVVIAKELDHNPPKEEKVNPKNGKLQPDMRAKFIRGVGQKSFISFALGGATAGWLFDQLPNVGRLYLDKATEVVETRAVVNGKEVVTTEEVETGGYVRRLLTQRTDNYAAGFQSDTPGSVPLYIEQPGEKEVSKGVTWYDKILAVIEGR